jgi:hypothetical protein
MCSYGKQMISGVDDQPPLSPRRPLKLLVEDPSTAKRSSTLRMWTAKNADDVFICEEKGWGHWIDGASFLSRRQRGDGVV